ncbi:MAG: PIN domain-containing protein [Bdellovibrionota bacterium]
MAVLVDTGILYAAADRRDRWHKRALEFLRDADEPLLVPFAVLPEACYFLQTRLGIAQRDALLDSFAKGGLVLAENTSADLLRAREICGQYRNVELDLADACLIAVAERLKITRIATTDRRDFSLVRPAHCDKFELLP